MPINIGSFPPDDEKVRLTARTVGDAPLALHFDQPRARAPKLEGTVASGYKFRPVCTSAEAISNRLHHRVCSRSSPIFRQEPFDDPTGIVLAGIVLDRAVNSVRHRPGFAVTTRGSVAIELKHRCVADCPSAPCVPKHLAGFFHAL